MSSYHERVDRLRERAEKRAEAWSFADHGPEFSGIFQYWTTGTSPAWGTCPVGIFVDDRDHEWAIWCWHKVLAGELVKADPQAGELVFIRHLGKVEPAGGGQPYDSYRVVVDREKGGGLSIDQVASIAGVERELPPGRPVARPPAARSQVPGFAGGAGAADPAAGDAYDRAPVGDDDVPF